MPRYRKKPVDVDAVQYTGGGPDPDGVFRRELDGAPYVITIHGDRAYLKPGDWIITEPNGKNHYPCKPDIFAATYEAVPAVPAARRDVNPFEGQ